MTTGTCRKCRRSLTYPGPIMPPHQPTNTLGKCRGQPTETPAPRVNTRTHTRTTTPMRLVPGPLTPRTRRPHAQPTSGPAPRTIALDTFHTTTEADA